MNLDLFGGNAELASEFLGLKRDFKAQATIDLKKAEILISSGKYEVARVLIHKIYGGAGVFECKAIQKKCEELRICLSRS